jgi:glycosyltransferase involved in cell wall biosynthesis
MPRPDVIVASLPPHDLAYESVRFGREHGIPAIVDIRDPWPDIFLNHVPPNLRTIARSVLHDDFKMVEATMKNADGLVSVSSDFMEWGLKYADREKSSADRIFHLGHQKRHVLDESRAIGRFERLIPLLKKKFIVIFIGTISKGYHDPSILLEVAEKLADHEEIYFVIAGDGSLLDELKRHSRHLHNLAFTGWLDQDEMAFFLKQARIGVCPCAVEESLPTNKTAAYLSAGLPVISAFQGEIRTIIEEKRIGFYYPPQDEDTLASHIKELYNDPELYRQMSGNAEKVFRELFDADNIYREYAEYVEKMAKR